MNETRPAHGLLARPIRPSLPGRRPSLRPGRGLVALALAGLVALGTAGCASTDEVARERPTVEARGAIVDLETTPELEEIARLEDARHTGKGRLQELLRSPTPRTRARAALALGRMPLDEFGAEVTQPLCDALADPDPEVRATVAFAIGQRRDPTSAGALLNFWNDPDPGVRARIVEAASRLDDPSVRREILRSLGDGSKEVVIEAVIAPHRWARDAPDAAEVERALLLVLSRFPAPPPSAGSPWPGEEIVWRVLFTLQRRESLAGRGAYLENLHAADARARIFAAKGLAAVVRRTDDGDATRALVEACADSDWRVVVEAVRGLGEDELPGGAEALLRAVEHPSAHVRREALLALGNYPSARREALPALWRGSRDVSADTSAAALRSLARLLPPDEALALLERESRSQDPVVRVGAAAAASLLPSERAVPLLLEMTRDEDLLVAGAAIEALGAFPVAARPALRELLTDRDLGLRLGAVLALRESTQIGDLEPLVFALDSVQTSEEDIASELTANLLENLGRIGTPRARTAVEMALAHRDPYVRRVAERVLREDFGVTEPIAATVVEHPTALVPVPGRDFPAAHRNPTVEVATSRGSMVFELFPAEAPTHVQNFLELAKSGYYDDLRFHRVVPDFVIQGGDYRGDGNGGRSWRGDSLRNEIGMRKFVRGSLGMPRNDDLESGGSQFFVCHRPTPHLDGRYTIFGELRSGFEVLDRIEVGDRILGVRVLSR